MHPFLLPSLLVGTVASMFLVLRGAPLPPAPLLGLLAVAFVAPLRTPRWAALLAVLAGGILVGSLRAQTALRHERSARETAAALVHDPATDAPLWIGTVLDGARPVEPPTRVRLRVHSVRFADGTTVQHHGVWAVNRIESGPLLAPGDRVALRAVRMPDRGALHPWTWDPAAAQRVRGVVGTLRATGEPVLLSGVPSWRALPDRARQRVERALFDGLSPETAGVAVAMVTGTRDAIPAATRTLFADTGAAHVLAVSGMHLALLSAALFGAVERGLRWIPRLCARWESRRIAAWGMVPCVVAYVVFTGAPVSAVRAGLMAGLVFLAIGLGRPSGSRHGLLLATWVLLLWNPWWLFDAGFQLSVTATFALVFLAPLPPPRSGTRMGAKPAESPTGGWERARRVCGGALRGVWASLRVSVAASLGTLPPLLWHFGTVPLASPLTNLIVVPPLTLVALPGACLGAALRISGLTDGAWTFAVVDGAIHLAVALGDRFGDVLRVSFTGGQPGPIGLVGCTLLAFLPALWRPSFRAGSIALAALGCVLLAAEPSLSARARGELALHAIPVGQGDCTLVELPDGTAVLVDVGPEGALSRSVVPYLRSIGRDRVDAVLVSHADLDHIGNLAEWLGPLGVRRVDMSRHEQDRPATRRLVDAADALGVEIRWFDGGVYFEERGGARWDIYVDPAAGPGNDGGIVLRVCVGATCALLTGDAERSLEEALLHSSFPLRASILKVGHHGSGTSSGEHFLDAVRPQVALVQAGSGNRFGFPAPEVLERLGARGVITFDTMSGCVPYVRTVGGGARVRAHARCGSTRRSADAIVGRVP